MINVTWSNSRQLTQCTQLFTCVRELPRPKEVKIIQWIYFQGIFPRHTGTYTLKSNSGYNECHVYILTWILIFVDQYHEDDIRKSVKDMLRNEFIALLEVVSFLATPVALHLTPDSKWVSGQSFELA